MSHCFFRAAQVLLLVLIATAAHAQLTVLKDIGDLVLASESGIDSRELTDVNGTLFFAGRTAENGYELFKTDGVNVTLVKDIYPGSNSSSPSDFYNFNGILYFIADDGIHGPSLYKSDGTASGTVWVKSISSTNFKSGENYNDVIVMAGGTSTLYFAVRQIDSNTDLWQTDGTTDGTVMLLEDFNVYNISPDDLVTLDDQLFFFKAGSGSLWTSNGTIVGTKEINVTGEPNFTVYSKLKSVGGSVYFVGNSTTTGTELWKTDGTDVGTQLVKDITANAGNTNINQLIAFNGQLLFNVTNVATKGIWSTDGTSAGTQLISTESIATYNRVVGNKIYYSALNGSHYELRVWDGTTKISSVILPMPSAFNQATYLTAFNNVLYFLASNGDLQGLNVWKSDGTTVGTMAITEFPYWNNNNGLPPSFLTAAGSSVYFTSESNAQSGNELWENNGVNVNGLVQLTDQPATTYGGAHGLPAILDDHMYFAGANVAYGQEPWKSDGTEAGTTLLKDILVGSDQYASSQPGNFISGNHKVFFSTSNPAGVWVSDGTSAGTTSIANVSLYAYNLTFDHDTNTLYFWDNQSVKKVEAPYTTAEPFNTPNIPGTGDFIFHQNDLWFLAYENSNYVLYRRDHINNTNVKLKAFTCAYYMKSSGNNVYMVADDGVHGEELWKSDGTVEGTVIVKDINAGDASTVFTGLYNIDGKLYFVAQDETHGSELWTTDGSEVGTTILKDINPGAEGSTVTDLLSVDNEVYFAANDGVNGKELWMTDGTPAGTKIVSDINEGMYSSDPMNLINYNGTLYFTAYDNTIRTLWKTNGTSCGTIKVTNNTAVIAGGQYRTIQIFKDKIYVEGWTQGTGLEFYVHDIATDLPYPAGCIVSTQQITFGEIPDKTFGGSSFSLTAASDSGLPVKFTTDTPGLLSISGNTVTMLKPGKGKIIASQDGDGSYRPADEVSRAFCIDPAKPVITSTKNGNSYVLTVDSTSITGVEWILNDVSLDQVNFAKLKLNTSGTYAAIVLAGECASEMSESVEVEIELVSGLEEDTGKSLNLYPNPAADQLYIETGAAGDKYIELLDTQGRSVYSVYSGDQTIDIPTAGFVTGLYIIRVNDESSIQSRKIEIRHSK